MKKLLFIRVFSMLLLMCSCSVSTKNIDGEEKTGFYFKTKSKYIKVDDEDYRISIPKKINDGEKLMVKVKEKNGEKIKKELTQDEYLKIQEILNSNKKLSEENKKSIQKILNLNS